MSMRRGQRITFYKFINYSMYIVESADVKWDYRGKPANVERNQSADS